MNANQKEFLSDIAKKNTIDYAIKNGEIQLLKDLVKKGAKISTYDFSSAARSGNLNIVKYLIKKGANIGNNVVSLAAANGHLKIVKYLVEKGVEIDDWAVSNAAENGRFDIVKYLVEKGADVTEGILGAAAYEGHFDIVKYLVDEKGLGDLSKHDYDLSNMGDDAAGGAAENGHLEILKYIVEKFSVVWGDGVENWEENGGEPPMCQRLAYHLPKAARNGHFDIVKYLIEKGAEIDDESASCAAEIVSSYHMSYRYSISTLSNIGISIDGYLKIVKLFEIVKFLEEEGLSRCEALAIYNKIEAGELKFPE